MADDWPTRFTAEAFAKVDTFLSAHPTYTRLGVEQPSQGATNRVIFARSDGHIVVFKVFCEAERKQRECFGLRHWKATGLVPELIWDEDDRMIVISYVPGMSLRMAREQDDYSLWSASYRETGKALASLISVPLSATSQSEFETRYYEGLGTLESYLGRILELGWSIHALDPDFRDTFWRKSLTFIEAQLGTIFSQPRLLYHQDAGNAHVEKGRFMGFFDLEMCRVGCAAMQLASSPGVFDGEVMRWKPFQQGWEAVSHHSLTSSELQAVAAAYQLLRWREISRYMSYDGTSGTGYTWASPADPLEYREQFESVVSMLGVSW
jgi:hypothetical protein